MELGSGSGTVITFIGQLLGGPAGVKAGAAAGAAAAGATVAGGEGVGTATGMVDPADACTYTQYTHNCYMAIDINMDALEMYVIIRLFSARAPTHH
jgi:hypothetical protein